MNDPDLSGQQLRKALGTVNDLQPPADDLFVQRAILRGRARLSRRRNAILGAAAAFVIVGGTGSAWIASQGGLKPAAQTAAGAQEDAGSRASEAEDNLGSAPQAGAPGSLTSAGRDSQGWFVGPMTPQRAAFESLAGPLTTTYAATFSGAWSTDQTNSRIIVALTRRDAALESLISSAMPAPGDVKFVVATHSFADKAKLADEIRSTANTWTQQGVVIESVTQDLRADRIVIVARGTDAAAQLTSRYGADWVIVTVLAEGSGGILPDGSTLPTLHR